MAEREGGRGGEGAVFERQGLISVDYLGSVSTELRSKRSPALGRPPPRPLSQLVWLNFNFLHFFFKNPSFSSFILFDTRD